MLENRATVAVQQLKTTQETKDLQDLRSDLEEMQNNNKPSQDKLDKAPWLGNIQPEKKKKTSIPCKALNV